MPVDAVRVYAGDTSPLRHGPTSGGSMTLASVAPAVRSAAHDVRTQLLDLAADMYEISASDLVLADGEVSSLDGTLRHEITEVTSKLGNSSIVGHGSRGPNPEGMRIHFRLPDRPDRRRHAHGRDHRRAGVAVHDVGRIMNPMGARSQVMGGVLQAIGFALTEERVVDPTTGTVVNADSRTTRCRRWPTRPRSCASSSTRPTRISAWASRASASRPSSRPPPPSETPSRTPLGVRLREAPYTPRRVLEALAQ